MLGLQSILFDWGWKFNAYTWMDATAGIAIGSRRGLGRVKHIDTVFLWVQAMVAGDGVGGGLAKEILADVSLGARRCCGGAELRGWAGSGVPVRREQANPESVIPSVGRDDRCAETWKLVTAGSGNANSRGYSFGTGSIRHDELMESGY